MKEERRGIFQGETVVTVWGIDILSEVIWNLNVASNIFISTNNKSVCADQCCRCLSVLSATHWKGVIRTGVQNSHMRSLHLSTVNAPSCQDRFDRNFHSQWFYWLTWRLKRGAKLLHSCNAPDGDRCLGLTQYPPPGGLLKDSYWEGQAVLHNLWEYFDAWARSHFLHNRAIQMTETVASVSLSQIPLQREGTG
jgi:hypothetical protein